MPVAGKSTGAEYMIQGKVAEDVIELIATWTQANNEKE